MSGTVFGAYARTLHDVVAGAAATDAKGEQIPLETAVHRMGAAMRAAHDRGNRIFFVGNGGSAGICSHLATDFSKNGGMRASALNDGATLTCLGNDYGYEFVFSKQIEWHARPGDVVVAISSSGRSKNILNAVDAALERGCEVFTMSGFGADNPLRARGAINVFTDSPSYGFVEVGHLAILHGVLDIQMGWLPEAAANAA
jgi:D-sedoheptulose 7-phosphate isomerase